ncbi:PadR family transcriptional regulator [Corynebacterium freiburgense]|uniref:PadR family transcriptional regulator n=1 Tax=Corynebacterium freiburgense TaxID=556548 RepID=UPI000420F838|nr:PadR family transcriptional regulator [Corynebacterium freiburgense]WJZ02465.1 Transcriptional regulator PadR-like family protein [Corynebacterium freiburgense]
MKLRHAILGLLARSPQSGYDLSRAFASSVVHFWHADQSQIYRTLDRMEADGAISTQTIIQNGRPNRRIHSLTEAGKAELEAWLASPLEPRLSKDPLLARIFFAAPLGHEKVNMLLGEAENHLRAELAALRAIEFEVEDLDTTLKHATLRYGIDEIALGLKMIEQIRESIANMK